MTMIETNLARAMARQAGLICVIDGNRLCFYTGDPRERGKLVGSTLIDDASGYFTVSRNAVEKIIADHEPEPDTSDIPEKEAEWFARAKRVEPGESKS
jgi:hypothetical protein